MTTQQPDERLRARSPGPARGTRGRGTKQAQALATALAGLPGFCSAQEIHAELRRKGEHVGLATVYRHLQALSEQGQVDAIRDANGETLYRQCGTSVHHHHLTCRTCGRSVEVEGRAVEQWAERVAAEAGFTDVGHTVELFGLCPECAGLPPVRHQRVGAPLAPHRRLSARNFAVDPGLAVDQGDGNAPDPPRSPDQPR